MDGFRGHIDLWKKNGVYILDISRSLSHAGSWPSFANGVN